MYTPITTCNRSTVLVSGITSVSGVGTIEKLQVVIMFKCNLENNIVAN
jgi:hypothetical protein